MKRGSDWLVVVVCRYRHIAYAGRTEVLMPWMASL